MATLHQKVERFLIYIATSFLCAIVLVVPIIMFLVLYTGGAKNPEPVIYEPKVVADEDVWHGLPLNEAIKKTKLESFAVTSERPELFHEVAEVTKKKKTVVRPKIDLDMAPNCPTCPYTHVSKYFKFAKYGCPEDLNTRECCFCGRPPAEPKRTRVNFDRTYMNYSQATGFTSAQKNLFLGQHNDSSFQKYYPIDRCNTCPLLKQLSWIRDGECDESLNNKDCCYDGGDCISKTSKKKFTSCLCYQQALDFSFGPTTDYYLNIAR